MKTRNVILETDWYTDCDDVVAARILCNLQHCNVFKILGASINASFPDSVRSLDGFLRDNGIDVPVAIVKDFMPEPEYSQTYQTRFAHELTSKYTCNEDAEEPVHLYRRLLAQASEQVDILSIGFTENIARLLLSQPDDISPMSGLELVRSKVGELWIMAGKWDEELGHEYNFCGGANTPNIFIPKSSAVICEQWPAPITFLGAEVGESVISGTELPESDILKQAMIDHGSPDGRSSWDPMLVLLAAAGSPEAAGYSAVRGKAYVSPVTGENCFTVLENGPHRYVIKNHPDSFYQERLNQAMQKNAVPCWA